jgi:uncharacterized protein (TIGR02145 family)
MKNSILLIFLFIGCSIKAQVQQNINKPSGTVSNSISEVDSIRFNATGDSMQVVMQGGETVSHVLSEIDSVTFFTITDPSAHSCGASNVHNPDLEFGTMTDQEGNVYRTIVIGTQEWMAENLNTGTYRNGEPIPTGLSDIQWNTAGTASGIFGACANFNNNEQNSCPFGKLYNFYAVTDPRNLCPTGWHVPTDDEWTILTSFLGGEEIAGGKMKSTGLQYWNSPNQDASNESGFSGLAGGMRYNFGLFDLSGFFGLWWSSTSLDGGGLAWFRSLSYSTEDIQRGNNSWEFGYSIRCLKD